MKKLYMLPVLLAFMALLVSGCGVNKDYVAQQISDSEAKIDAKIKTVSDKTNTNDQEITKLKALASQLSEKADLAINKASGFENYQIIWSGEINFDFDSYEIDNVAGGVLNEAGEKLENYPGSLLEIAGYTDITGSAKYNFLLGEKRANAAKRFLAERFGINLYRMFIVSYGEDKPVALPDEKHANAKNRRVTLTIWGQL
ncbi:MAG: OmpA family protein [candidate division Zixibacteria bacterium]|nr:OmpA family protein [candidate division Zixibacteria bacterium]